VLTDHGGQLCGLNTGQAGPRFRGDDLEKVANLITASFAGATVRELTRFDYRLFRVRLNRDCRAFPLGARHSSDRS
jgi:hypothetical protein